MPKPGSKSTSQPIATPSMQSPPILGWMIVLIAIVAIVFALKGKTPIVDGRQDQQNEQVIDKKASPKPAKDLKDCVLIAVFDKKSINEDLDYTITMQNDEFWKVAAPAIVSDVEFLEDDDDIGKKLLAATKLPAPVVALFNEKAKKLVWAIPLPKGGTSEIEKRLK